MVLFELLGWEIFLCLYSVPHNEYMMEDEKKTRTGIQIREYRISERKYSTHISISLCKLRTHLFECCIEVAQYRF